jgi:hypothetical protein
MQLVFARCKELYEELVSNELYFVVEALSLAAFILFSNAFAMPLLREFQTLEAV